MKEFEEIYNAYYRPLYSFILKLASGNELLAEEITQEAFYQAYISIHRYNGKCMLFTWLCQVAKNCYFKYLRKHREAVVDFSQLAETLLWDEKDQTDLICEKKMLKEELRKAINGLNKKQREIVLLRVYFELSFHEIGKMLGMRENTVKVNYHRGKEQLKKAFASHFR